jgi:hypothetical protein
MTIGSLEQVIGRISYHLRQSFKLILLSLPRRSHFGIFRDFFHGPLDFLTCITIQIFIHHLQ